MVVCLQSLTLEEAGECQFGWQHYYNIMQRRGIGVELAKREARRRTTLIGSLLVHFGYADGMICGTFGYYDLHLGYVRDVIGTKSDSKNFYAFNPSYDTATKARRTASSGNSTTTRR